MACYGENAGLMQFLLDRGYRAKDGREQVEVRLEGETVWLDAHRMGRIFDRDRSVILRHIRNIYTKKELTQVSTCAKNAQVAADGKVRQMDLYNLDMISPCILLKCLRRENGALGATHQSRQAKSMEGGSDRR